jgi:hypothetical protein
MSVVSAYSKFTFESDPREICSPITPPLGKRDEAKKLGAHYAVNSRKPRQPRKSRLTRLYHLHRRCRIGLADHPKPDQHIKVECFRKSEVDGVVNPLFLLLASSGVSKTHSRIAFRTRVRFFVLPATLTAVPI